MTYVNNETKARVHTLLRHFITFPWHDKCTYYLLLLEDKDDTYRTFTLFFSHETITYRTLCRQHPLWSFD